MSRTGPEAETIVSDFERGLVELAESTLAGSCRATLVRDAAGRAYDYELSRMSPRFAQLIDTADDQEGRRGSVVFGAEPPPFLDHLDIARGPSDTEHVQIEQGRKIRVRIQPLGPDTFLLIGRHASQAATATEIDDQVVLAAINRILTSTIACRDEAELGMICLQEIERLTGSAFGWIGELNEDGLLDTIALSDPGWVDCMMPSKGDRRLTCNMELSGLWAPAVLTGEPMLTNNPANHPAATGLPEGHPPLHCFLGVPLHRDDRIFGMIALANRPGGYRPSDLELAMKVAPTVSEVLHRKRYEDAAARHRQELETAVEDRTTELSAAVDELQEQNRRFLSILDAHPAVIYLADPQTHELIWVNRYFREILGYDPTGKICHEQIQGLSAPCSFCTNDIIKLQPGEPYHWEYHNPLLGIDLEIVDILIPWTDGRMVRYEHAIDVSDRKRTQRQLESFIAEAIDGYWLCDRDGNLLDVNPSLCQLLGYGRDELLTMTVGDIETAPAEATLVSRIAALARGQKQRHQSRYRRRDGHLIDVDVSETFLEVSGGRLQGFVRDVSQQRRHEKELNDSLAALARSNQELEQFAYLASHDLQEPLRKVQAFGGRLETMLADRLDDKSRDYLGRMIGAADRMQQLIDDLLAYSRITTRAQPTEMVDLAAVAARVAEDLELRIEETAASLTIDPLPSIEAEPVHMQVLFQNLVANALKFHRPGVPPEVAIGATSDDAGITLTVTDNGIGFEPQYAERIFKIFQRLHPRGEYAGTGIGLAICQKIVERHGGTIEADGDPGAGATFTVILPWRQPRDEGNDT